MTKKLLSALLTLAMVFTVIAAIPAGTAFAADTTVIDFEDAVVGSAYSTFGFTKVTYPSTSADSGPTGFVKSVTIEKDGNANNRALAVLQNNTFMYLTDAEMTEIAESGSRIKKGTSYYQAVMKQFGTNYYYIGYNTGLTGDAQRMKYWVKCDAEGNVTDASTNPSNNNYFAADGTPRETRASGNTEVKFPKLSSLRTSNGKLIGSYSVKFDFTQPNVGNIFNGYSDTVCFRACGTHPFYMTRDAFRVDSATNFYIKTGDDSQQLVTTKNDQTYIGKTRGDTGVVASADKLDTIVARNDGEWHTIEIEYNFDEGIYRVFYDDKPLYYNVSTTCYSSEFVITGNATLTSAPDVCLYVPRDRTVGNHAPIIDDLTLTYDVDTIETKLTWSAISNGQSQAAVISNLNLVESITVKGVEYPVTWSSSNPNVISNKGIVVRSDENTSATLTATVGGKTITFNVGVAGKSGKKQVFLAGDSHMSYYEDSWYPQKGWGQYIGEYFSNTDFYNEAVGGQSTKSFYDKYYKEKIYDKLSQGDYVIISFGTNDANTGYSTAVTEDVYAEYLQKYIDEIKGKNAVPVFVTCPNYGTGVAEGSTGINAYMARMKQVASQNDVAVVDLRAKHISYITEIRDLDTTPETSSSNTVPELVRDEMLTYQIDENYGVDYTTHPSADIRDDGTDEYHFSERGAKMLARWVATEIYKSDNADLQVLAESMIKDKVMPTIYAMGDSLMYNWAKTSDARGFMGWGECIGKYFDGAKVDNRAYSGASTNTFRYHPDFFPSFKGNMFDDDYLIISLGYNDAGHVSGINNRNGENTDPNASPDSGQIGGVTTGANLTTYKENLVYFVNTAKERGVTPILVTFPNDGSVYNNKKTYVQTIRDVAEEEDVPLIDLRNKHLDYITEYAGQTISVNTYLSEVAQGVVDEMHSTKAGIEALGFTNVTRYDSTHFNLNGAQTLGNWFVELLMESTDPDLAVLQSLVDEDAIPSETLTSNELKITGVEFDATPDSNGRTGAAIKATLPEGRLTRMKWVFAADDGHRYYSSTIVPETAGVKVSGDVKFGIVFNNGTVDADGNLNGNKEITGVDAIFMIDGMEFFTNLLDKAAKIN